jgi:peptide-methionine (R)-S-oxide reductase
MAANANNAPKVTKTEDEWKQLLTDEEYRVLRQAGTERPFTGEYNLHFEAGVYHCKGCNASLFEADSKFNSHCGWPSFDRAISKGSIIEVRDISHGMIRTEVRCASCDSHLGHIFPDGPTSTGMRYCINSVCLTFNQEP